MKIAFVGDINLGEYYPSFGHGPRSFLKKKSVFAEVENYFSNFDIVVGNLEAPITNHNLTPTEPESMVLRGDPLQTYHLRDAGFKLLQISNNHTIQHGKKGFVDTINLLKKNSILTVGLAKEPLVILSKNGIDIGFMAASDVSDNTDNNQSLYQALDSEFIERVLDNVKFCDHLVVMLHWGSEESTVPLPYQRNLSEKLYSGGVRAVIGTHPHLCYEIESRENYICAYSLGNFVFDLPWDRRLLKTGVLGINFNKKHISSSFLPITLETHGCCPIPTGYEVPIKSTYIPYKLGSSIKFQTLKAFVYLIRYLLFGNTKLKLIFLWRKILRKLTL